MGKNLIREGVFYYHPELQIAPPPPAVNQGSHLGSVVTRERFYLEIKPEYNIESLIDYFRRRFPSIFRDEEEDLSGMNALLRKCDVVRKPMAALDLALFAIDEAYSEKDVTGTSFVQSPYQLTRYLDRALVRYEQKIDACKIAGIDHIIPRRR